MLDTDVFSEAARARNAVLEKRLRARPPEDLVVSAVTAGEIEFGLAKNQPAPRVAARLQSLREAVRVLHVDARVAAAYGSLRDRLRRSGTPIGPNDIWIAAHAMASDLTLVSGNEREFSRVGGLRFENWLR